MIFFTMNTVYQMPSYNVKRNLSGTLLFRCGRGGRAHGNIALDTKAVSNDTIRNVENRPSHREILKKLVAAREKVSAADWLAASLEKLLPEFDALDLVTLEEQNNALETALNEIAPEFYAGGRPPQRSYEDNCEGAEMFAFSWDSPHHGKRMYLKFCFVGETLYVVSFHEDREREGGRQ